VVDGSLTLLVLLLLLLLLLAAFYFGRDRWHDDPTLLSSLNFRLNLLFPVPAPSSSMLD
jgi:hypothetical protein